MEIPGSGVINRYIAAQGPLPETSHDFWAMVWDQRSSLVVMLTTNVERGRVKCHKYWPDVGETCEFEQLMVTCVSEMASDNGSYILRNFTLTHDDVSFIQLHSSHILHPKFYHRHHHRNLYRCLGALYNTISINYRKADRDVLKPVKV